MRRGVITYLGEPFDGTECKLYSVEVEEPERSAGGQANHKKFPIERDPRIANLLADVCLLCVSVSVVHRLCIAPHLRVNNSFSLIKHE